MIAEIQLKNFEGIREEITASFFAKSRNTSTNRFIYKTHDNKKINKLIGLSGANGSGKSSFLRSFNIINRWFSKSSFTTSDLDTIELDDELKNYLENIRKNLFLKNSMNDYNKNTTIKYLLYLSDSTDKKLSGYYEYTLDFALENDIVTIKKEKLIYFRNHRENEAVLINVENIDNSQVEYIKSFYENIKEYEKENTNSLLNNKRVKFFSDSFENIFINMNEYSYLPMYISKIKKALSNDKQWLIDTIKLIDNKIEDIYIDEEAKNKPLVFKNIWERNLNYSQLSAGTKKMLNLMVSFQQKKMKDTTFVIDELDASLNSNLIRLFISTFYYNDCQLIFSTQYPEIFDFISLEDKSKKMFRNDQVFYTDIYNDCTIMFNLNEKNIRTDIKYSDLYRNGKLLFLPNDEEIVKYYNKYYTL